MGAPRLRLLGCTCAVLLGLPAHALRVARGGGKSVGFIRIQKTGGTTWGEKILPELCPRGGDCASYDHWDFDLASESSDTLVTILRDPVERVLSEFFFLRSNKCRSCPFQPQWDFQNDRWARLVQEEPVDVALDTYLHAWPEHPSFNRQVLYLAGFKGEGKQLPFRWESGRQQQEEFLARAKSNLGRVRAFGFTDCFLTSAAAMARALDMDEAKAVSIANSTRSKAQDKLAVASELRWHRGRASIGREEMGSLARREADGGGFLGHWRSVVDEGTVGEIERLNWADVELHRFALEQFRQRFGRDCVGN